MSARRPPTRRPGPKPAARDLPPAARRQKPHLSVWKFGGASLADSAAIRKAAAMIAAHEGPLVVVSSAMAGVTDELLQGAQLALDGNQRGALRIAERIRERHRRVVGDLVTGATAKRQLHAAIDAAAKEYRELCAAVPLLGHVEPRASDVMVSRGERLAAAILAAVVAAAGRKSAYVDGVDVIATDGRHGGSSPLIPESTRVARKILGPLLTRRVVPFVPGFIGRAPDGTVTTLGRGGSDLTATTLARALGAREAVLWKDVPGILTADPRVVGDARLIPQLHHREAAEVAYYGAKVLHPRALIPLDGTRIVLRVRSFVDTSLAGTEVSARRGDRDHPVKAVAVVRDQAVVTVAGKGMAGVHGIAARTFAAVDAELLSVSTIFQASSESSIGFTLSGMQAARAVKAIERAFRDELSRGLIDSVTARPDMSVIAVVGDGMVGTPGIASRVFTALATAGISVVAIAQGSSERNISFVVAESDANEAVRRIHSTFQLSKIGGGRPLARPHTDVVLLGFGRVGRELADQIAAANGDREVRVVGLLDRSGYVFDPRGISRRRLLDLARRKDSGALLASLGGHKATAAEALAMMASHAVSDPVLVDVTSEETGDLLRTALGHAFHVVMANKKPVAGPHEAYEALMLAAARAGRQIKYEATVGAGLPIIDTYAKLDETGDRVLRIEGSVSGTLMYVVASVSAGKPFSQAVREAVALGYAEPDPRDDLSGADAARKVLILARLMGYRGPAAVAENLIPAAYARLSLGDFMERLPELDQSWAERTKREAAKGRVLRYVVVATPTSVSARLAAVDAASPIGALQGTRNLVAFTTRRYRNEPLAVSGPGAGPAVTAAGILNDIYSLSAP